MRRRGPPVPPRLRPPPASNPTEQAMEVESRRAGGAERMAEGTPRTSGVGASSGGSGGAGGAYRTGAAGRRTAAVATALAIHGVAALALVSAGGDWSRHPAAQPPVVAVELMEQPTPRP